MRTRCEQWHDELVHLVAALQTREATAELAGPFILLVMRLEELFARRRTLRVRTIERLAHLQAFRQDAQATVEALWQKVRLLQSLGDAPAAESPLRSWISGPARPTPTGAALARLLARLEGISSHPECAELIYLLQELQLEIEMDEREALEDKLREEELALDAEAFDRDAAALLEDTGRRLGTLFFAHPRMIGSYFLTGKKPAPKGKDYI
jgi:hypothetical protein